MSNPFRQSNEGGRYQCGECGAFFAGLRYFDKHRPPASSDDPCLDPASVGLALANGIWGDPVAAARLSEAHSILPVAPRGVA